MSIFYRIRYIPIYLTFQLQMLCDLPEYISVKTCPAKICPYPCPIVVPASCIDCIINHQPRTQGLSSCGEKTLVT
jgi:hypothetical protein